MKSSRNTRFPRTRPAELKIKGTVRTNVLHPTRKINRSLSLDFVREYLETLDSPRAIGVWMLFASGTPEDLTQLVNLTCDPSQYIDAETFRPAYAATKFLAKCKGLKTGINLSEVAIQAAEQAEIRCRETNLRFKTYLSGSVMTNREPEILRVREKIRQILGPAPETLSFSGWSKGRTTSASGTDLSPIKKFRSRPDVTVRALRHALRMLRDSPQWGGAILQSGAPTSVISREAFDIVEGNVMLTVPKSAKTDRVICYEPHLNIALQLSVGKLMRERLRRHGVNLDDQSINQRRARLGSKYGQLATIDLRSASDTVAREVVEQLLPIDWVCLLDDLRSHYTKWPDGSTRRNEKFSSMGNGFTFELESLLFYAICCAVATDVSVYGDDLIVPTERFEEVTSLLTFFGFEINTSKSFSTGYFRESCGYDGFGGTAVTPVYLRSLPRTVEDVLKLHNAVVAFCDRDSFPHRRWLHWLRKIRQRVPCLRGPMDFGDGHYHVNWDEAHPTRNAHGLDGWWFDSFLRFYRRGVGDGIENQEFHSDMGSAVLSAATGPKAAKAVYDQMLDRRFFTIRRTRILSKPCWREVDWGF